jgi:hypothetical protein
MMEKLALVEPSASARRVGHSQVTDSATAGRDAVRAALAGHTPTADDLVVLFASADHDVPALYRAAADEATPAAVVGCSSTGGFTDMAQVPSGCVAALLVADERSFGVCHIERDDDDLAGSARGAAENARERAGDHHANSVLLVLTDGLTPDQREIARGVYEVTTAVVPFVGGAAADSFTWDCTQTFGDGVVRTNGILAVWINSARPMGVSVDHGWRPSGKPMLVTRAAGTVIHELDGVPALEAFLAEQGGGLDPADPEFFLRVLESPVGLPNARGRYDVRQLHAFLPEGGGINLNCGVSEQTILQVMSSSAEALIEGARSAARHAIGQLSGTASLALVFDCGSRVPLLGTRANDEIDAISSELDGVPICGFYTYGEFARTTGSTGFHNSSVAILAL